MSKITSKIHRKYGKILGVRMTSSDKNQLLEEIEEKLTTEAKSEDDGKFFIVTPNPEIVLKAQSDLDLKNILNEANFSVPDGVGLKIYGDLNLNILPGRKLMLEICKLCETNSLRVFVFGGSTGSNARATIKLKILFPSLEVEGDSGSKYTDKAVPVSEVDLKSHFDTLQKINNFKPSIVFVALGCPKQEYWISKYLPLINAKSAMTVGGAIDYLSGEAKNPPAWMETFGIEWFWRLLNQPMRFKRIFNAVLIFPLYFLVKSKFFRILFLK